MSIIFLKGHQELTTTAHVMFHTEIKVVIWTDDCIVSNLSVLFLALMCLLKELIFVYY